MWSVEVEADFSKKGNASLADGVNLAFAAKVKISVMSFSAADYYSAQKASVV